jgi:diguanylate cyclase (GGDEF)-like protein/PAS domain S-box-containing protein
VHERAHTASAGFGEFTEAAFGPQWPPGLSEAIWDACPFFLVLVDRAGVIAKVNRTFAAMHGSSPDALADRSVWELLPSEVGLAALACLDGPGPAGVALPNVPEQVIVDPLGNRRRISWSLSSVVLDGARHRLLAAGVDLTGERTVQASLRQLADTDSLTGLANREFLERALVSYLDPFRGAGASLLFCDLDGFKAVNDTHGHQVGDQVLKEIATRLTRTCRPDDLVARIGGDEFVILVSAGGGFDARAMTTRLDRAVNRPLRLGSTVLRVGVSIGVRVADVGEDPTLVLADADTAMYQAKRRRRTAR